jgi:hypothetical protein
MKYLVFTLILLLGGCCFCPSTNYQWTRGDLPMEQFARDNYECARDNTPPYPIDCFKRWWMYRKCMESKGYILLHN